MKRILSLVLAASAALLVLSACGGQTAERAKDDVKGAGKDLSNGVGTQGPGLTDGVGVKTDGGSATDGGTK